MPTNQAGRAGAMGLSGQPAASEAPLSADDRFRDASFLARAAACGCRETLLSDVGPVRSRQRAKLIGSQGEHRKRSATCRPDGLEAPKVFIEQQLDRL